MKILYLSCHSILEYDEIRIFYELGADVFSHGAYSNPQRTDDKMRPNLNLPHHSEFSSKIHQYPKENLDPDLVAWCDVVVCMHNAEWLLFNLEKLKGKRLILRTIGQNTIDNEKLLRKLKRNGVEIVRYSPRERTIPGYAGEDAIIRFAKYPDEYGPWQEKNNYVITHAQAFKRRHEFNNYDVFVKATEGLPRKVYGTETEDLGDMAGGFLSYEQLRDVLKSSRLYFYTGTYPASYTLGFVEAAMSGIPLVALGDLLGNWHLYQAQRTYEVAELLRDYFAGLTGDNVFELKEKVQELYNNKELRKKVSKNIRNLALDLFNVSKIKEQWKKFLGV